MVGDNVAGFINLYICRDGKVIKLSRGKWDKNEPMYKLSLQEVLHVQIAYESVQRIPSIMLGVWFERLQLNEVGQYTLNRYHPAMQNFIKYAFDSAEELSKRDEPLTIPVAPIIPTQFEKEALNAYLKNKFPVFLKNSPQKIELTIKRLREQHKEYIELIKKANDLRKVRKKG